MKNYSEQEKRNYYREKQKKFREEVVEMFIASLSKPAEEWKCGWLAPEIEAPMNAMSGYKYKGVNRLKLMMIAQKNNYTDPRWITFKQIQENGLHLKKGSRSVNIEYYIPFDGKAKKFITWEEYKNMTAEAKKDCRFYARYSNVFHGSDVEGLDEYISLANDNNDVEQDVIVDIISTNMGVMIFDDGGNNAYYKPSDDSIHLPERRYFNSTYDYNGTALHELTHATGAVHRLNRNIHNDFGSSEYAYEELVAEIGSTFMSELLKVRPSEFHIRNHVNYVRNWIIGLRKNPAVLFDAIRDSERAAEYLERMAYSSVNMSICTSD